MRQVSKDDFYRTIGTRDVHPSPNTKTHESLFKTPTGRVVGMTKTNPVTGGTLSYHLP